MVGYRWIQTFLILTGLQFTGASIIIRLGADVSFPCNKMIPDQDKCNRTTWIFSDSRTSPAVTVFEHGQIHKDAKSKSDRLRVTEKCSLVINNVTVEDVGRYTCRQFDTSGQKQGEDSVVDLSVVTMTQHEDVDQVTLNCSVWTRGRCRHTVKWLNVSKDVKNNPPFVKTSQSPCNVTVTVLRSHHMCSSFYTLLTCEVMEENNVQLFPFSLQPPSEKPGEGTSTTAATDLVTNIINAGATTTPSSINSDSLKLKDWWWLYVTVALVLAALLILAVIAWKRTKGNKSQANNKVELTTKPAETQSAAQTTHNLADAENYVSYASVSFNQKDQSEAQVHTKNDDDAEGHSVTYSTVKASSTDPSNLYASIK